MTTRAERPPKVATVPVVARPYQGRRAGIVTRLVAGVLDVLVIVGILCALYAIVTGVAFLLHPRSFQFPSGLGWSIPVVGSAVAVPYLTLCWRMTGRTYGDAVFGLRVVNRQGQPVRFVGALLRAVLCVLFPIGLLWIAISPANRSVQDVVLRTSVIYDWLPAPE